MSVLDGDEWFLACVPLGATWHISLSLTSVIEHVLGPVFQSPIKLTLISD